MLPRFPSSGRPLRSLFLTALVASLACLLPRLAQAAGAKTFHRGELDGAKFTVAEPEVRTGKVLLLAHGFRSPAQPTRAEVDWEDAEFVELLDQGWLIGSTSYRRNGWIVDDAVADLETLRRWIVERYGEPELLLVQGRSMGGVIVVQLAERIGPPYDGVLGLGSALQLSPVRWPGVTEGLDYTYRPRIPVLLLSNRDEIGPPAHYAWMVKLAPNGEGRAVFRSVDRDGHVYLNDQEILAATGELERWATTGNPPEFYRDGTRPAPAPPSTARREPGAVHTRLRSVDSSGHYRLGVNRDDLAFLGLGLGDAVEIEFAGVRRTATVTRTIGTGKRGEWTLALFASGATALGISGQRTAETQTELSLGAEIALRAASAGSEASINR